MEVGKIVFENGNETFMPNEHEEQQEHLKRLAKVPRGSWKDWGKWDTVSTKCCLTGKEGACGNAACPKLMKAE